MGAKPVVGVSFAGAPWAAPEKEPLYLAALERAGAGARVVRPGQEGTIPDLLRSVSGWLFTGGDDIAPELYGQEPHPALRTGDRDRDRLDLLLARAALAEGKPFLAICLGVQVVNVAAGGTLVQDIPSLVPGAAEHRKGASHRVAAEPGTRLAGILGAGEMTVNSFHHQSVGRVGSGFRVAARSPDGVIEALEREGEAFQVGVQWHPERPGCPAAASDGLFAAFVAACTGRIPLRAPAGS